MNGLAVLRAKSKRVVEIQGIPEVRPMAGKASNPAINPINHL